MILKHNTVNRGSQLQILKFLEKHKAFSTKCPYYLENEYPYFMFTATYKKVTYKCLKF